MDKRQECVDAINAVLKDNTIENALKIAELVYEIKDPDMSEKAIMILNKQVILLGNILTKLIHFLIEYYHINCIYYTEHKTSFGTLQFSLNPEIKPILVY